MTIKKAFVELNDFLEANKKKKVSTILDKLNEMMSTKVASSTVMRDADEKVIAIFCYYHKQWELVKDVPYGAKASNATGLNSMCKVGTSLWTKQNREAKKAGEQLLADIVSGKVEPGDLLAVQADIKATKDAIDDTNKPVGFANEADVLAQTEEQVNAN